MEFDDLQCGVDATHVDDNDGGGGGIRAVGVILSSVDVPTVQRADHAEGLETLTD